MRLAIAICSALLLLGAPPPSAAESGVDLRAAVVERLTQRLAARAAAGSPPEAPSTPSAPAAEPQVTVAGRSTDAWGFGTAVLPAPLRPGAYPEGWLFVAYRDGARWRVALEGEPEFATLSGRATILGTAERRTLGASKAARPRAATDRRTLMRLPYALGQRWRYTGGPHPMSGSVRSSIDLAGGDGRVLAARAGVAYTMCRTGRGWLRVVHEGGYATDYYHLEGNIRPDGAEVPEGAYLGEMGVDVSCGGRATGPHVHFSLRRDGEYVPIDRYAVGKWVIREGAAAYQGLAQHGSAVADVGDRMHNYGALAATEGIVDTDDGRSLNRRKGPGTGHPVIDTLPDGATVAIACSARGTTHTGRGGYATDLWNRLTDGGWVSDAFVWTGTPEPVNGYCPDGATAS